MSGRPEVDLFMRIFIRLSPEKREEVLKQLRIKVREHLKESSQ